MKRGNTALKRVVSVASVAAMAIAGAVLAAPAASAAVTLTDAIRALPAKDAAYITTPANTGNHYVAPVTVGTGAVPNLTVGTSGAASGFQIVLPAALGVPGWAANDKVTIKLGQSDGSAAPAAATKVTFGSVTGASVASKAVTATTLDSFINGTSPASAGVLKNASLGSAPSISADGSTLSIELPDPTLASGSAGDAYVLTVTGVSLNVPSDVDVTKGEAVTATVSDTTPAAAGTTTIAFINALNIAANGTGTAKGNVVTLPPIVVKEAVAEGFDAGSFSFTVTGTDTDGTGLVVDTADATFKASSGITAVDAGVASPAVGVTVTGSSTTTSGEAVAVSGVTVSNVKPGTELTVTVDNSASALNSSDDGTTNTSAFSATPDQDGAAFATFTPGAAANRVAGDDRYDTAAQLALKFADASAWSQNAVVIANGENATNGVDALSANFLAGVVDAPILLTQADKLPKQTSDALTTLFKDSTADIKVYVMGKTASVSQDVRDAVKKAITDTAFGSIATVTVVEVAGDDRYETSVKTVDTAKATNIGSYDLGKGFLRTAFLASGQNNADALAASAVSFAAHIPALLTTDADALPDSVKDAITADGIKQVVILGGTDRVSKAVADALTEAGVNVIRLAGSDRSDTAAKIATLGFKSPTDGVAKNNGGTVYLANGFGGFADALAAGPLAGTETASLLTISDSSTLPASTQVFLASNKGALDEVDALGGTDRVTADALSAAQALIK